MSEAIASKEERLVRYNPTSPLQTRIRSCLLKPASH